MNSDVRKILELALEEDIKTGDITTEKIVDEESIKAVLEAKEDGIICGLGLIKEMYEILGNKVNVKLNLKDGDEIKKGDIIAEIDGNARIILSSERTLLNFLQRLSGVATTTKKFVDKTKDYDVKILDTRKTSPGMRYLEKYAVRCGGGINHRFGLYDMVLIKENHISASGSIKKAFENIKDLKLKKEIEVENIDELKEALETDCDWIMLDNMSLEEIKEAVKIVDGKKKIEVSGKVSMENVEEIAKTGVDFISIGRLTHSFKSIDISLRVLR